MIHTYASRERSPHVLIGESRTVTGQLLSWGYSTCYSDPTEPQPHPWRPAFKPKVYP